MLPNYGSTDREPPEPAEHVELVEPVKPAKPVKPVKPVAPGNLWNLWKLSFFCEKKNAIDCFNDISYACTSTMNVATIEVGHQGQLKHISLLKCSSLYPKTNFQTVLRSF